jgi:hypothetical protein
VKKNGGLFSSLDLSTSCAVPSRRGPPSKLKKVKGRVEHQSGVGDRKTVIRVEYEMGGARMGQSVVATVMRTGAHGCSAYTARLIEVTSSWPAASYVVEAAWLVGRAAHD